MSADLRDFPAPLCLNMARETLAEAIHLARREAFQLPPMAWADLDPEDRECLRDEAAATLERVKPTPAVAATQDTYWEMAKSLTRAAFRPPKDAA